MSKIKKICCWCKKVIGEVDSEVGRDGVCTSCANALIEEQKADLEQEKKLGRSG